MSDTDALHCAWYRYLVHLERQHLRQIPPVHLAEACFYQGARAALQLTAQPTQTLLETATRHAPTGAHPRPVRFPGWRR